MKFERAAAALVLPLAIVAAGCDRTPAPPPGSSNPTSVLGGAAPAQADAAPAPLVDARGEPLPSPPAPAGARVQAVRSGDDAALAVWLQDGHVAASSWSRAAGWSTVQVLEAIYGRASDPQVATNGRGKAMAVWRHTVGSIESLRFSRFEPGKGWSTPDVVPGALPRADAAAGQRDAPRLRMDVAGNVLAEWPSGFHANEMQSARYVEGQGWTGAASAPVAQASSASPAHPAPSSAR